MTEDEFNEAFKNVVRVKQYPCRTLYVRMHPTNPSWVRVRIGTGAWTVMPVTEAVTLARATRQRERDTRLRNLRKKVTARYPKTLGYLAGKPKA